MSISYQLVKNEAEALKCILQRGDIEIPPFFQCYWLGGAFLLCNLVLAGLLVNDGLPVEIFFAFIVGFIFMMSTGSAISLYLSIPKLFRENSEILFLIKRKCSVAITIFIVMIMGLFLLSVHAGTSIFFMGGEVISLFIVFAILNMDLGRYQLTMFTSVLNVIRDGKCDPASPVN